MQEISGKPDIKYPCEWKYAIIGEDEKVISNIVSEIIKKPYILELKNHSKKGKFISLHLVVNVDSEEQRNEYFKLLSTHKDIKMVL